MAVTHSGYLIYPPTINDMNLASLAPTIPANFSVYAICKRAELITVLILPALTPTVSSLLLSTAFSLTGLPSRPTTYFLSTSHHYVLLPSSTQPSTSILLIHHHISSLQFILQSPISPANSADVQTEALPT
jgi:hypothetical protein